MGIFSSLKKAWKGAFQPLEGMAKQAAPQLITGGLSAMGLPPPIAGALSGAVSGGLGLGVSSGRSFNGLSTYPMGSAGQSAGSTSIYLPSQDNRGIWERDFDQARSIGLKQAELSHDVHNRFTRTERTDAMRDYFSTGKEIGLTPQELAGGAGGVHSGGGGTAGRDTAAIASERMAERKEERLAAASIEKDKSIAQLNAQVAMRQQDLNFELGNRNADITEATNNPAFKREEFSYKNGLISASLAKQFQLEFGVPLGRLEELPRSKQKAAVEWIRDQSALYSGNPLTMAAGGANTATSATKEGFANVANWAAGKYGKIFGRQPHAGDNPHFKGLAR